MKISEAIARLQLIQDSCGDLPIVGGNLQYDTPLGDFAIIDTYGCETDLAEKATGVFLEA